MEIKEAIKYGLDNTKDIEDKRIKIIMILSNLLKVNKEYLVAHDEEELSSDNLEEFLNDISLLNEDVPIQYIIGKQEFFGLTFKVNENVLIPRFDTEVLIEKILYYLKDKTGNLKILDLCTGSGAIGIVLSKKLPNAKVYLSDISDKALEVAKENATLNNVKVNIIKSDMFENISIKDFDLIVSNPPYIETNQINNLSNEVKKEPIIALDGKEDGLFFYRLIAKNAKDYLKKDGAIFLEIGYNQAKEVLKLLEENGFKNLECLKDYNNLDRVIKGE